MNQVGRTKQAGFHLIIIPVLVIVVGVIGFVAWKVYDRQEAPQKASSSQASEQAKAETGCPAQPMLKSPADLSLATAVLYPGQTRGNDYKPHGGLRFDGSKTDDITVRAPMDANLTSGSRYIEQGEVQVLLEFSAPCGIKYRFDHLLTLSDKFQKAVDTTLPAAKPDDSRTTNFNPAIEVTTGEVIATAVGFKKTGNVGFDFGVYDMRQPNGTNQTGNELAKHAVCWLKDWLPASDVAILATLPGGDGKSGKTSDYC